MASGIYWIRNRKNGKFYIGSSSDIYQRWREHRSHLTSNHHSNSHLQNAWNKYGKGTFVFEVLEETNDLLPVEQWYLDNIRCLDKRYGYNVYGTAGRPDFSVIPPPMLGKKHSVATRHKMSLSHRSNGIQTYKFKRVEQLTLGGQSVETFLSLQEAAKAVGVNHTSSITRVASGSRSHAHGFRWRYV